MADFDLQPHLVGEYLELRPLAEGDFDALYAAASDPLVWEQHPASDRYQEPVFREFFRDAMESKGALIAIDRATGEVVGSSRYWGLDLEADEIEIGWTFLARSHWGGFYNAEMKRLMIEHAFRFVGSVILMIAPTNARSQKAAEKVGGVFEGSRFKEGYGDYFVYRIREVPKLPERATPK